MTLLLDEHFAPQIARQLRDRGHDVVALVERSDLIAVSDAELLDRMATEARVTLTENAVDFVPLAQQWALEDRKHAGVLLTSPRTMPRRTETIGLFVRSLEVFLRAEGAEEACRNQVHWLRPVTRS